jgi:hypothetical protein
VEDLGVGGGAGGDLGGSVGLWVWLLDGKHPESRVQFVRREMRGRTLGRKIAHRVGEENATQ